MVVLWTLALLAVIVTQMVAAGRREARIAGNLLASAQAEAAADGALAEAIFRLADGSARHLDPDGLPHALALGVATMIPETGKINPNAVPPEMMSGLLAACGAPPATADALAAAIQDWRTPTSLPRPNGAKLPQYQAAGLDHGPPNAPFESLEEIRRVLGMTPALASCLMPHLSLFQNGPPDPETADPLVGEVLRQVVGQRRAGRPPDLGSRIVAVIADADGAASTPGGRFRRRAVVRLAPGLPNGYTFLDWGE